MLNYNLYRCHVCAAVDILMSTLVCSFLCSTTWCFAALAYHSLFPNDNGGTGSYLLVVMAGWPYKFFKSPFTQLKAEEKNYFPQVLLAICIVCYRRLYLYL